MYQLEMNTYNEGKCDTLSLNVDSSEFSTVVLTYRESQMIMIILNPHEIKVKKKIIRKIGQEGPHLFVE